MPPITQIHQSQPPAPPAAPMAPNHFNEVQQDLNMPPNGMGGERFNGRPGYHDPNRNVNSMISNGRPSGTRRIQPFASPTGSKVFQSDSYRMYEFKKHKMHERKPGWEIAERRMIPQPDTELKARIKKPAKDNRGLSSRRDFYSSGMAGYKQKQSQQLLDDLQRDDQRFEWRFELIELHELGFSSETGKVVCSKMIVVVSRNPRKGHVLPQGMMWPLDNAVVDLGPPLRQDGPAHRAAGGYQDWLPVAQHRHGAPLAHSTSHGPRPNIEGNRDLRPMPMNDVEEERDRQESVRVVQPSRSQNSRDNDGARVTPIYNIQEKRNHSHPREDLDRGHAEKSKSMKKEGKKDRPVVPVIEIPSPEVYDHDDNSDSDSSSSSNSISASEGHTSRSSITEISSSSSAAQSPRSDQRYFTHQKPKKQSNTTILEVGREHYRKNPVPKEYILPSRGRHGKRGDNNAVLQPASSSSSGRHNPSSSPSQSHPRSPSFTRHRPRLSPSQTDRFEDDLERYDDDLPAPSLRRRDSFYDRRLTKGRHQPWGETEGEREWQRSYNLELEVEHMRLARELKERDALRGEILRGEAVRERREREMGRGERFRGLYL